MKSVKVDLSSELKNIELHVFADWHIGDAHCDMSAIKKDIEKVSRTSNAFCILNGDLCNTATKTSVSDIYSETMSPMKQIKTCVELLTPIKDKILFITTGNHENRIAKHDGIDLMRIVARELGLEDRYNAEGGVLFLRFGIQKRRYSVQKKQVYSLYITHGSGGGKKEGGKINRLADLAGIVDVDIYVVAHTHLPAAFRESFYRLSWQNNSISIVDKLFVNTAAKLKYGGYGQLQGFKPASKVNPVIYLNGTKREFDAKV